MGTVVQLKNQINDSYFQLKHSVEDKLVLTEEKIKSKLSSEVELVQKMTKYHIETGGKRFRALLTLSTAKLCGYSKGSRDVNLAACVDFYILFRISFVSNCISITYHPFIKINFIFIASR